MASPTDPDETNVNHLTPSRMIIWQATAVIALFCLVLCLSLFIPAFIDDIFYLITGNRAGYDNWQSILTYPQCGQGSVASIPLTLLPGRWLAWIEHFAINSIFTIRLSTLLIVLVWIPYTTCFLKKCFLPAQPSVVILAGIIGFVGLGTLPFVMTSNRPEGAMCLVITLYASLPFWVKKYPAPPRWIAPAVTLFFALVTSWFFSLHPKSFFYCPLALLSAWHLRKWNKISGWLLIIFTALAFIQAWSFFQTRFSCPDSPSIRELAASVILSPLLLFKNPPLFLYELLQNIFGGIIYVSNVLFPIRTWLIPHPAQVTLVPFVMEGATSLLIISVIWCSLRWIAGSVMLMVKHAYYERAWKNPSLGIALCLLVAALGQWCYQYQKKPFYFFLIWVTFLLCGVMTSDYLLKHTTYWKGKTQWVALLYRRLCIISILSLYVLLVITAPATVSTLRQASPNGEIQMDFEWYLISPLHYEQTEKLILNAAKACHITPYQSSHHIGVDIVTYLPLKATYQPLRLFFGHHDLDNPSKFLAFLEKQQSDGVVALCKSLPKQIKPLAQEIEGVCCIPRAQITTP